MDKEKKKRKIPVLLIVFLFFVIWSLWSFVPVTERISLDLTGDEPGVRIVLITDLHSCYYGSEQRSLIKRIDKEEPDIIILGGDIFDDRQDEENSKILVEYLAEKYPCYYVTGNHEYWSGEADDIKEYLRGIGVEVLCGDCKSIELNGRLLDICGVDDPTSIGKEWNRQLEQASAQTDDSHIKILVSHRPERVSDYEKYDYDLILCGHAHAGQIRVPFFNRGLFAPDQGFMAYYVSGGYELSNGSTMIVSRGLARESTPCPRFFNHPEIVTIDL